MRPCALTTWSTATPHSGKILAQAVGVVLKEVKEAGDANTDALARGFVEPKVVSCADAGLEVDPISIRECW